MSRGKISDSRRGVARHSPQAGSPACDATVPHDQIDSPNSAIPPHPRIRVKPLIL